MLRNWQICFLLAVITFGLQLFPFTGVSMMIVAAPYWSVILLNLGFALMARDAWREPKLRWLMPFPLLWFGGYFVAASISHWQAYRYTAGIAAANASRRIAFHPSHEDVVIEPDPYDEAKGGGIRAEMLVDDFGLNRAYERKTDGSGGYRSYSLVAMVCPSTAMRNDDGTTIVYRRPVEIRGYYVSNASDLCIVQGSQSPERPIVRVRLQPQVGRYEDNRGSQAIAIGTPDGTTVMLRSGWARPLAWLPQPVIGCGLDSATPAWRCFARFMRQSNRTSQSASEVIVRALGLRKTSIRERSPSSDWN